MGEPPPITPLPTSLEVPATLLPALRQLARDYLPVLTAQRAALAIWLGSHETEEIPRDLGPHPVVFARGTAEEIDTTRASFTYDQWMLERCLAVFTQANAQTQGAIARLCEQLGAPTLPALAGPPLLARRRFRLVRAAGAAQAAAPVGR